MDNEKKLLYYIRSKQLSFNVERGFMGMIVIVKVVDVLLNSDSSEYSIE